MKDKIRTFNYYWDLMIPFGMAVVAIWYNSPYAYMIIWGGWLVFVLHITLFGQIHGALWEKIPTSLPYFILRIPLVLLIPTFNDFLTFKDYFYTEVLAETISLLVILIFMLSFHKKDDGESFFDHMGIPAAVIAFGFIIVSLYPFIAEIFLHFKTMGQYSWFYAAIILVPSLYFKYLLFDEIINDRLDIIHKHKYNELYIKYSIYAYE